MRKLTVGSKCKLCNSAKTYTEFNIIDIIGAGGDCIAYLAEYRETDDITHLGVLKEFCPVYLGEVCRDENGGLAVPDLLKERFDSELANFKEVYREINAYLSANINAANCHSTQLGLFTGNNTAYTLSAYDHGKSYDKISDESLRGIIKIALATAKAIEMYHSAGLLHLDIKPANILILDDVYDLVKLFDYNSLTPLEKIKKREITAFPVPESYYVPELAGADIRNIGITTDIFEIGAMVFLRLFGRAPSSEERAHGFVYNFDEVKLLDGASPTVKYEIAVLLKKTVQTSKSLRYSTVAELKKQLEKILELCNSKKPYLINLPKWQPSANALGRETELKTIKSRLDKFGYVFIRGMGGIGKSELAKMYVKKYADEYHTVQFCKYTDSLKTLIAAMQINGIDEAEYGELDKLVHDKNKILHTADSHTLIIVDNFNVGFDEYLRDFLPAENGFKVIFTTRCVPESDYYAEKTLELTSLPKEQCLHLFYSLLGGDSFENADELLNVVECNTLAVTLLASAVKKTGKTIGEITNRIKEQTVDELDDILFHEYDYEGKVYNKLLAHLFAIFNISSLSQTEAEMLKNMTLIPSCGISLNELVSEFGFTQEDLRVIGLLCDSSWLYSDDGIISMHPLISDLIAWNNSVKKNGRYQKLADDLDEYCVPDTESHITVVMNKLAFAVQLERRYKTEIAEKRVYIALVLGNIYMDIFDSAKASEYLYGAEKTALKEKTAKILPQLYFDIATYERDFGSPDAAIGYYKKSISLGNDIRIRDYFYVMTSMCGLGRCYFYNKNAKEAFDILKKTVRFARIHRFTYYLADIYDLLAEVCEALNLPREAEKYLHKAAEYHEAVGDKQDIPEFVAIADNIENTGFPELQQSFEKYLADAAKQYGEDSPMYKELSKYRWDLYLMNGDIQTGIRQLNEAISFVSSAYGQNSLEMVDLLSSACLTLPHVNEYETAFAYGKKAIDICEKNNTESYIKQKAYMNVAQLYSMVGDTETVKKYISKVDLSQYTDKETLTDALCAFGGLLLETGEYDKLDELCNKVLSLNKTSNVVRLEALSYSAFGDVFRENFDGARQKLEQAAGLRLNNGNYFSEISDTMYLRVSAQLSYKCGDYDNAVKLISEAITNSKLNRILYVMLMERGLYYSFAGNFSKAQEDYDTVINLYREQKMPDTAYIMLYNNMATNFCQAGNLPAAKEYLDKLIKKNPNIISEKSRPAAFVCANIGYVEVYGEDGDLVLAEKMLKRAISLYEELGLDKSTDYFKTNNLLACLYIQREDYKNAEMLCSSILNKRDMYFSEYVGEVYGAVLYNYIYALLNTAPEEAEKTVLREMPIYERYCGTNKEEYLSWLGKIGGLCRAHEHKICITLFKKGEEYAEVNNLENTFAYALLLNFIGAFLSTYGEHLAADKYLKHSVHLFEQLGKTDSAEYKQAAENLKENKKYIFRLDC